MKIIDPKTEPIPTCKELSKKLKIKPFAARGSTFSAPMKSLVGEICDSFEGIHDELVELYPVLVGDHRGSSVQKIKSKSEFSDKLAVCGKANKENTKDKNVAQAVQEWLTLCQKASEIRNMVVHGRILNIHFSDEAGRPDRGFFLTQSPDRLDRVTSPTKGKYCWNPDQLQEYGSTFRMLRGMLMTIQEELSGTGDEPHPEVLIPIKQINS